MTDCLGLPYELAWSCVIIEVFLYMLHGWLGDPVVPGWITPTLPFTLVFLEGFEQGPERIQAMIAVQLLVAFLFIFMGITKLADRFVRLVPASVKGGILLAAPITVIQGQLAEDSQLMIAPVATLVGTFLLAFLSFSPFCEKKRKTVKILDVMAKYGNLFPYLLAMLIGILLKELSYPELELGTIIRIPDFGEILNTVSIFAVGVPSLSVFLKAIPLALICYVLAFGDFVTSETLVKEAQESRDDEYIDFNSSRSNLISGLRNLILGIFAPFPPLCWFLVGWYDCFCCHALSRRGKSYEISHWWYELLPYGYIFKCHFDSYCILYETHYGGRFCHYIAVPGICLCKNRYGILQIQYR